MYYSACLKIEKIGKKKLNKEKPIDFLFYQKTILIIL